MYEITACLSETISQNQVGRYHVSKPFLYGLDQAENYQHPKVAARIIGTLELIKLSQLV